MLRQLTQAELACLAGVSRAVVVRLERPRAASSVRVESAERVLRALGVRIRVGAEPAWRGDGEEQSLLLH